MKDYAVQVHYKDSGQPTLAGVCSPSLDLLDANTKQKLPEARRPLVQAVEVLSIHSCAHQSKK